MKLSGKLNYLDEPGHLEVTALFVHDSSIAVDGLSNTPEYGSWQLSVELPLVQTTYQASGLHAEQNGQKSDPFQLRIQIVSRSEREVEIQGLWKEAKFTSRLKGRLFAV